MNLEEAKIKARAAGMSEEGLTIPVLQQFGWEPGNPLADVVISESPVSEEELNNHLALLIDEAKANNVPNQIIQGVMKFAGLAMKFIP